MKWKNVYIQTIIEFYLAELFYVNLKKKGEIQHINKLFYEGFGIQLNMN